jgi:hypothetical protein
MASEYKWGYYNPFQDFLLKAMLLGADIADEKSRKGITDGFTYILKSFLENEGDVAYLDFDIISENGYVRIIGNNSVSALWLSGIIPEDTITVLKYNTIIVDDRKYVYNKKTKKLSFSIIKN